jgi:rhamnosyltransferase
MVESNYDQKLCAIIVTYNPDQRIRQVIESCINQVDLTFIIDNASLPEKRAIIEEFNYEIYKNKINLIFNSANLGLSKAYNYGIKSGLNYGCGSFLFLDQDSILWENSVDEIKLVFSQLSLSYKVGALNFKNVEARQSTLDYLISRLYNRSYRKGRLYYNNQVTEVKSAINSGLFITVETINRVGLFDEELFVDAIDHDFSYRLRTAGLKIFSVNGAKISHNIREDYLTKGIIIIRNHNVAREYYIIKDSLIVVRKWYKFFFFSTMALLLGVVMGVLFRLLFLPCRWKRLRVVLSSLRKLLQ